MESAIGLERSRTPSSPVQESDQFQKMLFGLSSPHWDPRMTVTPPIIANCPLAIGNRLVRDEEQFDSRWWAKLCKEGFFGWRGPNYFPYLIYGSTALGATSGLA